MNVGAKTNMVSREGKDEKKRKIKEKEKKLDGERERIEMVSVGDDWHDDIDRIVCAYLEVE